MPLHAESQGISGCANRALIAQGPGLITKISVKSRRHEKNHDSCFLAARAAFRSSESISAKRNARKIKGRVLTRPSSSPMGRRKW